MSEYAEGIDPDADRDIDPDVPDPEQDAVVDDPVPHQEEADEADVLEQAAPVTGDDDDYPNDLEVEPDV